MITLGGIYFMLAIIGSGFIWYEDIKNHMLRIDSNAVLLIALAATIATIVLSRKYSENKSKADENTIQLLNNETLNLKQKINEKDLKYLELTEQYNALSSQNRSLVSKLNQTTTVMEQINRKIDGGKQRDE
jgi:DNA mismatch repair ATPase MutS